jgi:hypothetical protein
MRRLLGELRENRPPADGAPYEQFGPAPGLDDLGQLITRTVGAGVRVDLDIDRARRPLPVRLGQTACRVIQGAPRT